LPLYNDWESLALLLDKINNQIKNLNKFAEILVVNDNSTMKPPKFESFSNINKIHIINLKSNLGSQKAISIGLNYLKEKDNDMIITILDSDGEDDVSKIPYMIYEAEKENERVIVSTRTKRQENFFFKLMYFLHKLLTFAFTLKWISYGNYSSFNSNQISKILSNNSSWLAFSACLAKNCNIKKIRAERKKRLIGDSKLSLLSLIFHSLRVNAVFPLRNFLLSSFYISFLTLLFVNGLKWALYVIIVIIFYYILLILTIMINNQKKFFTSLEYLENT